MCEKAKIIKYYKQTILLTVPILYYSRKLMRYCKTRVPRSMTESLCITLFFSRRQFTIHMEHNTLKIIQNISGLASRPAEGKFNQQNAPSESCSVLSKSSERQTHSGNFLQSLMIQVWSKLIIEISATSKENIITERLYRQLTVSELLYPQPVDKDLRMRHSKVIYSSFSVCISTDRHVYHLSDIGGAV